MGEVICHAHLILTALLDASRSNGCDRSRRSWCIVLPGCCKQCNPKVLWRLKAQQSAGYLRAVQQHQERDGDQVMGRGERFLLSLMLRTTIASAASARAFSRWLPESRPRVASQPTPMLRTKYLQQKNEYSHGHVIVFRIFSELLFAWRNNLNSIPIGGVVWSRWLEHFVGMSLFLI
jgi:hypothetical protein